MWRNMIVETGTIFMSVGGRRREEVESVRDVERSESEIDLLGRILWRELWGWSKDYRSRFVYTSAKVTYNKELHFVWNDGRSKRFCWVFGACLFIATPVHPSSSPPMNMATKSCSSLEEHNMMSTNRFNVSVYRASHFNLCRGLPVCTLSSLIVLLFVLDGLSLFLLLALVTLLLTLCTSYS